MKGVLGLCLVIVLYVSYWLLAMLCAVLALALVVLAICSPVILIIWLIVSNL